MIEFGKIEELQESLVRQYKELLQRVSYSNKEFLESPPHISPDRNNYSTGDGGAEEALYNATQALIKKDLRAIRAIETALQRIQKRNYGICVLCGHEISLVRLRVVPEAIRCVRCQTMFENLLILTK